MMIYDDDDDRTTQIASRKKTNYNLLFAEVYNSQQITTKNNDK